MAFFIGKKEEQINIRIGCHFSAPITANGYQAEPFWGGWIGVGFEGEIKDGLDDLVDKGAVMLGCLLAIMRGFEEGVADFGKACFIGGIEDLGGLFA